MMSGPSHWAMLACCKTTSGEVLYSGGGATGGVGSGSGVMGMMKIVIKDQRIAGLYDPRCIIKGD